jgi:hypothetical protein
MRSIPYLLGIPIPIILLIAVFTHHCLNDAAVPSSRPRLALRIIVRYSFRIKSAKLPTQS